MCEKDRLRPRDGRVRGGAMNYEQQIKEFDEILSNREIQYTANFRSTACKLLALAKKMQEEMASFQLMSWIPCSERLPEKNGYYRCTWEHFLRKSRHVDDFCFVDGKWQNRHERETDEVIAWTPSPEPYMGDV